MESTLLEERLLPEMSRTSMLVLDISRASCTQSSSPTPVFLRSSSVSRLSSCFKCSKRAIAPPSPTGLSLKYNTSNIFKLGTASQKISRASAFSLLKLKSSSLILLRNGSWILTNHLIPSDPKLQSENCPKISPFQSLEILATPVDNNSICSSPVMLDSKNSLH